MTEVEQIIFDNHILDEGVDHKGIKYKKIESLSSQAKDLTGQYFGKLIALFPVILIEKAVKDKKIYWLCFCECGKLKVVRGSNLTGMRVKSCGCISSNVSSKLLTKLNHSRRLDLKGQEFGELLVLDEDPLPYGEGPGVKYYWKCLCKRCSNIESVRADVLISGKKIYCELCNKYYSQGERKIYNILKDNNIIFETQKKFDSCRFNDTNALAKFDFYVNNEYIIEFDGRQHFKDYGDFYFNVSKIQEHDKIKNDWCFKNNIPIIRIPYTHLDKITIKDLKLETSKFVLRS